MNTNQNNFIESIAEGFRTIYAVAKEFNGKGFNIASNERRIRAKYPKFRLQFNANGITYAVVNNVKTRLTDNGKSIMFWDENHDIVNSLDHVIGKYTPCIKRNSQNLELSEWFDTTKDSVFIDVMAH